MIVTESEASAILCQETFGPAPTAVVTAPPMTMGGNLMYQPPTVMPSRCVGSFCMAWNWEGWRATKEDAAVPRRLHKQEEKPNLLDGWTAERVGSCGKCR